MSMDYIRKHFKVPAKVGMSVEIVRAGLPPLIGKITGSCGDYLWIKANGAPRSIAYHPTWDLNYITTNSTKVKK